MCKRKRNLWFMCRNTKFSNYVLVTAYQHLKLEIKKKVKKSIRDFKRKVSTEF